MIYKLYLLERFFFRIKLTIISIFIRAIMRIIFSCDIPYKTKIGINCKFPHNALGVLIHPDCIIGDNCTILHNVTIGGKKGAKRLPVIGNNVVIGTGAIIIGDVEIGDNSIIGAGAVVTHNVPPYTIYAGNPAKKIGENK